MSGQSEDAAYQKERADKAEAELENFKREARQLQEFLQAQSTKKQAQIRKLKEQSIMKQKAFKGQKVQISQLQSQITSLKQQLKQKQSIQMPDNSADLLKKQQQITHLKEQLQKLNIKNQQLIIKTQSLSLQLQKKVKQKEDLQNDKHKRQLELQSKLELITNQLQIKKQLLQSNSKKLNKAESKESGLKHSENRANDLQRKGSKKQLNINRQIFEKQRQKYEQKIRRFEQALQRSQKSLKDYKYKLQSALQQNQQLQYQLSIGENHNYGAQLYTLNSTSPINIKSIDDDHDHNAKINISCLLLTKQHYISPFLQIYEDKNLIKIYKSSRSGCFQKSMGYYRHKFNMLTYEQQALVESIVNKVLKGGQENNHSIILYGVKKSNKKYLMSKIIVGLKEFLLEKLQNSVDVVSAIFMKRSSQNEKNYLQEGNNKNSILQVLNKVIALGYKSQEKSKDKGLISPRKTQSKPKVRYFNIRLDQFYLQIGTSSYTNLSFRDKMTTSQMLNNIIFSKLPNQLQSSVAEKYLILTLNPIVDLYDECRNTLSTTICKGDHVKEQEDERNWKGSPVRQPIREQLNDMAKKKMQTIQRQNQQTSLKIRKLQQDCYYYKTRFDELQFRLKNLLNTHSGQNSYLKKSPITLSYQKLLKFVHSVQSRNNLSANLTQINSSYMLKSHIQAQKHNQSIDAL